MFKPIDSDISVAGQLLPEDMATARSRGFVAIINNRPDDEQPGQPTTAEIKAAAEAEGLAYTAIPIDHNGFSQAQIEAMRMALGEARGPVLAFCRSGTRSTWLWALARAAEGDDPGVLIAKAAAQGYDLSPLPQMITR